MRPLTRFLREVFFEGQVHLREPLELSAGEQPEVLALLEEAFRRAALELAGPPVTFSPPHALASAVLLARACWFLMHRQQAADQVASALVAPPAPRSPGDCFSADVVLRHLSFVHRRAGVVNPTDVLAVRVEEILRHWPLSGVLADIPEPPLAPVELFGHPGLLLLYAERLAVRPRPAWNVEGPARPWIELVFAQRKLPL
jgi:hypothetical protein